MSRSICISFVLVVVGASILVSADSQPPSTPKTSPNVPKELLESRLDAARNVFSLTFQRLQNREATPDEAVLSWSERWLEAELALSDNPADRLRALKAHVERAKELEKIATQNAKAGQGRESDAQGTTYFRIDAEIRLLQATPK